MFDEPPPRLPEIRDNFPGSGASIGFLYVCVHPFPLLHGLLYQPTTIIANSILTCQLTDRSDKNKRLPRKPMDSGFRGSQLCDSSVCEAEETFDMG
ncbi:hypothetical protein NCCP2716_06850 [Sporosarcina sp. NCCP-2716]|nr:hypothetical protein NCCP2716_06850 [Sporosarcina sp. NCCP-2716]